jgi:DNA-binding CsgD family transcriptional regulator
MTVSITPLQAQVLDRLGRRQSDRQIKDDLGVLRSYVSATRTRLILAFRVSTVTELLAAAAASPPAIHEPRANQTSYDWTPADIEQVKTLRARGVSFARIGDHFGVTGSVVNHLCRRLRLSAPATGLGRAASSHTPRAVRPIQIDTAKTCLWLLDEKPYPLFRACGEPVIVGKPYCPRHCRIAYVPKQQFGGQGAVISDQ